MLQLDARGLPLLVMGCARVAGIHGKGYQCDDMKNGLACPITTCRQVGHILYIAKGLVGYLDKEDSKGDIGRHLLHIDCYSVGGAIIAVTAHNCYQGGRVREFAFEATWHQRKLQDGSGWQGVQDVD